MISTYANTNVIDTNRKRNQKSDNYLWSNDCDGVVFYADFIACFDFADVDFVYGGDFADDGADGNDGFAFFVYHACGGGAVFLHAVERVAADCAAFALWENEDFAFDALTLQLMSFFDYDACVWVNAAVE